MLGDQSNYVIGRKVGPRVFGWEQSRWFNKKAFDQAHEFYERYGGVTIVARALHAVPAHLRAVRRRRRGDDAQPLHPLQRHRRRALGRPLALAGYLFGNIPWVKENLDKIIWGAILIPGLLVFIGAWRARLKQAKTA